METELLKIRTYSENFILLTIYLVSFITIVMTIGNNYTITRKIDGVLLLIAFVAFFLIFAAYKQLNTTISFYSYGIVVTEGKEYYIPYKDILYCYYYETYRNVEFCILSPKSLTRREYIKYARKYYSLIGKSYFDGVVVFSTTKMMDAKKTQMIYDILSENIQNISGYSFYGTFGPKRK